MDVIIKLILKVILKFFLFDAATNGSLVSFLKGFLGEEDTTVPDETTTLEEPTTLA